MLRYSKQFAQKICASASAIALTAGFTALPQTASAQDANIEEEERFGNQILVTAQKREESIDDVPITVSALSGENLQAIGVDEFDEVAAFIPGLIVQEQSPNNPGFVIRGITSDSGSAQIAPRVTIYYNGVDVSRSRGSYFDLFDVERIEVVKGPQATLFGTAATIGAISVITAKPQPETDAFVSASYGNFNAIELDSMINIGNDVIAARLASTIKRRDGYVENIAGEPGTVSRTAVGINQADLNGLEQFGIRGSLRFTPNPDVTIDLTATYEEQNNPGTAFISGTIGPTGGAPDPFGVTELGGSPFSGPVLGIDELALEREVVDLNLTAEFILNDNWTLTTVNGYRRFDSVETFDADGSALFFLEFSEIAEGQQFSHETRLSYESDTFRAFGGFNYFKEDGTQGVPFSTDEGTYIACAPFAAFDGIRAIAAGALGVGLNEVCGGPNVLSNASAVSSILSTALLGQTLQRIPYRSIFENGGENDSFSVFLDGTVTLGPVELTAGVRYLTENRRSTFFSDQPGSLVFAAVGAPGVALLGAGGTNGVTLEAEDDFDDFLVRFNALLNVTDDVNLYATVSEGRRSPVIDLDQNGPTLIAGEQVWNYEAGIKGGFGAFSGTIGVFLQEYSNFQVTLEDESGLPQPFNAGQAENFGVEIEAAYAPSKNLRIFANYAYIDAEIGEPADAVNTQFVGSRFRLTPEHSASGGIDFSLPIGDGATEFFATPTVTYQSRVFFDQPNSDLISEDGYTLVNIRAGISFNDGQFAVTGFARNLLDEEYLIDAGNTGGVFGTPTFIPGEPALYGIELSARY